MVYIHVKKVGDTKYYTLRVAVRRKGKILTKDLENLGTSVENINLDNLDKKYKELIRKSYKTLKTFLEENRYVEKIKKEKLKLNIFFSKEQLEEIEAARLHFNTIFQRLDHLTQEEIYVLFLIKFAVSSTSIEGNTISLSQAHKLLTKNTLPKDKTLREVYDLQNTQAVFFKLRTEMPNLSLEMIEQVHDALLARIDVRGGYRTHDIHILGQPFKPSPGRYVRTDMKLLLEWYHRNETKLHPLALAFFFHHKLENIHPFSDGNGRTGRILLNHILLTHGYPPLLVPFKFREEYLTNMSKADKALARTALSTDMVFYTPLFSFLTDQFVTTYWNTFLV